MLKKMWNTRKMLDALDRVIADRTQWDAVKKSLVEGADPSAQGSEVLRVAAFHRKADIVALALENGANPRANNNEAINWAVYNANTEVFDVLVKHDPKLVFDIRLSSLAQARYMSEHSDNQPCKERLAEIVKRVDSLSERLAETNFEETRVLIDNIVKNDEKIRKRHGLQ